MADDDLVPGTLVPRSLAPHIGEFIIQFSAMDMELNGLIWHIIGAGPKIGRSITASIQNYRPRATLLEWLAASVENEGDQDKLVKLANGFLTVADYRNRLLHDEVYVFSPATKTVGLFRSEVPVRGKGKPTTVSEERLSYMISLAWNLRCRMQQYCIRSEVWNNDEHFPWHDKPPQEPQNNSRQ